MSPLSPLSDVSDKNNLNDGDGSMKSMSRLFVVVLRLLRRLFNLGVDLSEYLADIVVVVVRAWTRFLENVSRWICLNLIG